MNSLFARRLAVELPEQQWWRSEPDAALVRLALGKSRELDQERRSLLTRLLGDTWEAGDMVSLPRPTRPGVVLDGPVLGTLPVEVKQAIEDISARSQERMEAYAAAQREDGKAIDAGDVARLRQQTRDELARILTPSQLEEYLLRYSQNANNLRSELGQLKYFNATPEEFRAVFRATDNFNQQLALLAGAWIPTAPRNAPLSRNSGIMPSNKRWGPVDSSSTRCCMTRLIRMRMRRRNRPAPPRRWTRFTQSIAPRPNSRR